MFAGDYINSKQETVATGWAGLTSGTLNTNLLTEAQDTLNDTIWAWTSVTQEGGVPDDAYHCNRWDSEAQNDIGSYGTPHSTNVNWTNKGLASCNSDTLRLICVEDPD